YCSDAGADRIYRMHFMPRKADARYSDMTESELIYRCLGIILESIASGSGQTDRRKNKNQGRDSAPVEEEKRRAAIRPNRTINPATAATPPPHSNQAGLYATVSRPCVPAGTSRIGNNPR